MYTNRFFAKLLNEPIASKQPMLVLRSTILLLNFQIFPILKCKKSEVEVISITCAIPVKLRRKPMCSIIVH